MKSRSPGSAASREYSPGGEIKLAHADEGVDPRPADDEHVEPRHELTFSVWLWRRRSRSGGQHRSTRLAASGIRLFLGVIAPPSTSTPPNSLTPAEAPSASPIRPIYGWDQHRR
ncbi:hypothetical protein LV779_15900 [Streptomyces thinghirensis]|nr:hypothetical protein [Streptomyces thinghirensis]